LSYLSEQKRSSFTTSVFEANKMLHCTWYGDDVRPLSVKPRQRQLPHHAALLLRHLLHCVHQHNVLLDVPAGELGVELAIVVLAQSGVVEGADGACEEAAPERRVRDDLDA
jgi:hypothetical protein